MEVAFVDLKSRYEDEKDELLACIESVLSRGSFVLTSELAEFEAEASLYTGVSYTLGVNSGTDALMMSLWALGIGKGDEVITSPVSFIATAGAIAHVGAVPKFVDIGDDFNLDPLLISAAITEKTKAVMPVHWGGRLAEMPAIMDVAQRNSLEVIEDAAQAMGAYHGVRHAGSFGRVAAFSGHPLKNLNALGDAGFICTNDQALHDQLLKYRNHGLESRDNCVFFGVNSRLDALHAKVLSLRLTKLDEVIKTRNKHSEIYQEQLQGLPIRFPTSKPSVRNASTMMLIQAERRDKLHQFLAEKGVQSMIYYGTPLHLHPALSKYGYKRGIFLKAEEHCQRVLALPHHQYLSLDQINYVIDCVKKFYKK